MNGNNIFQKKMKQNKVTQALHKHFVNQRPAVSPHTKFDNMGIISYTVPMTYIYEQQTRNTKDIYLLCCAAVKLAKKLAKNKKTSRAKYTKQGKRLKIGQIYFKANKFFVRLGARRAAYSYYVSNEQRHSNGKYGSLLPQNPAQNPRRQN